MYAYIESSNIARTDSIIQSLSWMNSISTLSEGWLATGNKNHIVSITYTSIKSDEHFLIPDRTNFNLRAHRTDVRFVAWNIPYKKLATIDEKGVIFVWVKQDNRWSLELINDRTHSVIDMSWSYDGRMTVICYEDGFILVGSVTGQRYWSTVLNIPQTKISAVTWMPDISHVIVGTTSGQLVVMNHHGNTTEIISLSTKSIRQLIYSCNKFYPEAPDNNAKKFINEDYILACSLENGQILLLNNYQDQSPMTIDTNLQNIQMDWSFPDEILVVGGYQRLNDINYNNQIIFYNRRGEFLHRIHIPQTTQPLTALCWAHGNEIVFVACGLFVYTIWIIHKPLPSMLTLCQMKIKENLLKNSLENLSRLSLPNNLKENLCQFYRSTIKGFLPDQKSLRSFVCYPLKSHLRLQCTMKRIDNKSSTIGAIYVLYFEYLGGLIPLLTAKRISKICPNFIIFDPQIKTNHLLLNSSLKKFRFSIKKKACLITNRNSIYVAETDLNNNHGDIITTNRNLNPNSDEENIDNLREKQNTNKLCTIMANIWGTHFKFYGHSHHLPSMLGSVTYKTSFLHLQPRQMKVTVANNYKITNDQTRMSSRHLSRCLQRTSIATTTTVKRPKNVDSSSTSPVNLSRSTSPAASIPNFIRPISPPCIQVKEPLSPKFSRASSSIIMTHHRHDSSERTALLIDKKLVSNVPENCFEPETYRNLYPLNSNQQKKLSFSDPTLNQTRKISQEKSIVKNEYFSNSSLHRQIQSDDEDEIENLNSDENINESQKYSLISDIQQTDNQNQTSFYVMQNRPPLWNEQSQVYQLDFGGRVTLESAKNFQIEFQDKQVIQFGRIENNCYTLDFEWPFSPLQAFAVALANITQRLK